MWQQLAGTYIFLDMVSIVLHSSGSASIKHQAQYRVQSWLKTAFLWHSESSVGLHPLYVYFGDIFIFGIAVLSHPGFNGPITKTIMTTVRVMLAHLPWTTMGLFPVLLCITNTCSLTAMMAGGEVHRPSGVQQGIWNWVTLCSWPDCRRTCRETIHGLLI